MFGNYPPQMVAMDLYTVYIYIGETRVWRLDSGTNLQPGFWFVGVDDFGCPASDLGCFCRQPDNLAVKKKFRILGVMGGVFLATRVLNLYNYWTPKTMKK